MRVIRCVPGLWPYKTHLLLEVRGELEFLRFALIATFCPNVFPLSVRNNTRRNPSSDIGAHLWLQSAALDDEVLHSVSQVTVPSCWVAGKLRAAALLPSHECVREKMALSTWLPWTVSNVFLTREAAILYNAKDEITRHAHSSPNPGCLSIVPHLCLDPSHPPPWGLNKDQTMDTHTAIISPVTPPPQNSREHQTPLQKYTARP